MLLLPRVIALACLHDTSSRDTYFSGQYIKKSGDSKVEFSEEEEDLIIRMFNLVGERWSLIAGRIPGRSAEEIEKYWNSRHPTSQCSRNN
ncbi:unnamed protein product [Coffea canephora]|uniref:Uncharacterized protein n=1 Tax=Coffea canephora TaxID=49390 RepID=A0A068TUU3_COFCA|nr:unnamed protein product [Coffea canephora]